MSIIDSSFEKTYHAFLNGIFPGKLLVKDCSTPFREEKTYIPLQYANLHVYLDDESIVGRAECSNCKKEIDIFVKFCPNCGFKIKEKVVLQKKRTKNEKDATDSSLHLSSSGEETESDNGSSS